ncbi:putative serine esterase-domain-containing protein [Lasiosphaeria hispida]|uniref:Serine esterase-domain-containing protein n=1 Tax=Lasiosphaeria hispida TaxID=260671 RepID=A0AAJ0HI55_9PEZI|nr:putative serine esterase-domain-containing protein [Lasiosphaeria hispida]
MLLLHQAGSVKIGEVVRYTITYTPSSDRILPSPDFLFLRIKNTSAIALRAAFVHGPYTLSVAAYPSNFNPNEKFEDPVRYGVPEFEPMLKAGAVWNCHLVVPEHIRQSAGEGSSKHGHFGSGSSHEGESVTWIVEVTSQVIFSSSAAVHYEILMARDEKSLNLGSVVPVVGGQAPVPQPGRVCDFQQSAGSIKDHAAQPRGVYSKAIRLKVEDTATLWNTPQLPGWDEFGRLRAKHDGPDAPVEAVVGSGKPKASRAPKKQKKLHLVVLTHGLHSNLGADLLYLKESIDAGVKKAKVDARARRARERAAKQDTSRSVADPDVRPATGTIRTDKTRTENNSNANDVSMEEDSEDDEEVVVRGFSGNATKTERGIKYLGKRLANFILSMTYPDQPCLPLVKAASEVIAHPLKLSSQKQDGEEKRSSKHGATGAEPKRLYKITKISFIAHSLGGLVQTYAIAYIQKHSPQFFDLIEPINFITMASPLLGLNHENPLYVKFALDFGLVGRTGQDLGLTWRAPTIARSGWGAIVGNLGENAHRHVYGETQAESKPLLRILPTGPAHRALKKFRNRTVYSNVVNDGIVPLRTSCLLFLDWQGLGRVDKARREAGLVETVVGFGWAELTGATVTSPRIGPWLPQEGKAKDESDSTGKTTPSGTDAHDVPLPPTNATLEDDRHSLRSAASPFVEAEPLDTQSLQTSSTTYNHSNPFTGFFSLFRNNEAPKAPPPPNPKQIKIYKRSQTLKSDASSASDSPASSKFKVTSGQELTDDFEGMSAPPRTTFFESAGDLLNPKMPSIEYLIDPSKRARTIFHDRVYHPSDIPPPPLKKRATSTMTLRRKSTPHVASIASSQKSGSESPSPLPSSNSPEASSTVPPRDGSDAAQTSTYLDPFDVVDNSQMKVEEKIARAYHRELSWRKVLVKVEPDAHNNIIVRRMFANAFGWPVVNHLVDAHFSDSAASRLRDDEEQGGERAKNLAEPPDQHGTETHGQPRIGNDKTRNLSEAREAMDSVPSLPGESPRPDQNPLGVFAPSSSSRPARPHIDRIDSMTWSDRDWADSGDDSEETASSSYRNPEPKKQGSSDKAKTAEQASSPLSWNWTEKIVGRGAAHRPRSSRTPSETGSRRLGSPAPSSPA